MTKRIPTYIDTTNERITEFAADDILDISIDSTSVKADTVEATSVETTTLTVDGVLYAPFDPSSLDSLVSTSVKSDTYIETVRAPRYQGSQVTIELNLANNFTMDFSNNPGYVVGLSGAPSGAGDAYGFTLTLDTAGMAGMSWDNKIKWSTGTAPTLTADTTYVFTFLTTDNGTTFKAFVGGEGFA